MCNLPFISVIIPVYNDQIGINSCLAALASQTYSQSNYEIIVVDNASNPPITINPTFFRIARLVNCSTPGSYAARNAGIRAAYGELLAFTDADCVPDQNWIRAGVRALVDAKENSIIGGEVAFSLSKQPTAVELYQYLVGFMQQENIKDRGFSATANLFVTRRQVNLVGEFAENLLSGGDREWCWRAAKFGFLIKYAPEVIVRTLPRSSLISAIRQARRVAGGRYVLRRMAAPHVGLGGIKPHRSIVSSIKWILMNPALTLRDRIKVFGVATLLKVVQLFETARLYLGLYPERR